MYDKIVIVGNGKTSRENVEALIDDYLYANKDLEFILFKSSMPLSDGQRFAEQYLKDKNFSVTVSNSMPDEPNMAVFILWDDDDEVSHSALESANKANVPAFDLTNGLYELTSVPVKASEPVSEPIVEEAPKPRVVLDPGTPPEPDHLVALREDDRLLHAVKVIAEIFAAEFVKAMNK